MNICRVSLYALALLVVTVSMGHAQTPTIRKIVLSGTTSMQQGFSGTAGKSSDRAASPEVDPTLLAVAAGRLGRDVPTGPGVTVPAAGSKLAASNPEVSLSFDGLTHRDHRLANDGNQTSVEPPDQGLCAGNGFVLETVNNVLRVYDATGSPASVVRDHNTFYGYAAQFNRSTGEIGPAIADPSCYFDPDTQHWFHVLITLERVGTTAAVSGRNHIDLAVSQTSSPLGAWNIYKIPTQDDGTDGTPNHHCDGGPCYGDYPHLGADANGIYITTNEYPLFPSKPGFTGAQIYALPKRDLAAGASTVTVIQFDTAEPSLMFENHPAFTVWPALTPASTYAQELDGTEYFLSSIALFDHGTTLNSQSDNRLRIWSLSNTRSLNTDTPDLKLQHGVVNVETYAVPHFVPDQKAGDFPVGQCLNDTILATPFGTGCWRWFSATKSQGTEVEPLVYTSFSIMQGVVFTDGKLWSVLNTGLGVGRKSEVGIAYFIIRPEVSSTAVKGQVVTQGNLGLENNHLTYPAIGVTASGKGVISFTLVGQDHFPSAAYAMLDAASGAGDIHIVAEGLGPEDGWTGYRTLLGVQGGRPAARWGDYGATAVDGNSIWIGSEYIGQSCTLAEFAATLTLTQERVCGGTRTALGNWYTRITKITP